MLEPIIAERVAWRDASLIKYDAAKRLGWTVREFLAATEECGIQAGRFGRYAIADVDALAGDEELSEQVRSDRLLGPDQAAAHLEIRRTDFDYCTAAGWIRPVGWADSCISSRRTVEVPLYRVRDVEALRELPGVDWEAVRTAKPGDPSPLREHTARPAGRADLVRGYATGLGHEYGIDVDASYDERRDRWQLTWTPNHAGEPSTDTVLAALRADRDLAPHASSISCATTDPSHAR